MIILKFLTIYCCGYLICLVGDKLYEKDLRKFHGKVFPEIPK